MFVHLISSKLDAATKREWESKVISDNWSTVDELTKYSSDRYQLLETVQANKPLSHSNKQNKFNPPNKKSDRSLSHVTSKTKSYLVKKFHLDDENNRMMPGM